MNISMKSAIAGGALLLAVIMGTTSYNGLVSLEENLNGSYAEYQNQLGRQADLLPNLASVVSSYMKAEQKTMIETAAARAGELSRMKPSDVANNPELQKHLIDAQAGLGRAMVAINAAREAYPELKANRQVEGLMAEVAGSQNRVTIARGNNQKVVREYNATVRTFPRVVFASVFGFKTKPYYDAGTENQRAPKITL